MTTRYERERIDALIRDVEALRDSSLALEREHAPALAALAGDRRQSGRNLLHYLAVRQHDLRKLQEELAALGLSSLGRLEPHALGSIDAVLVALRRLSGRSEASGESLAPADFAAGARLLAERTEQLLGPVPKDRRVRVMVTMASEAAEQPALVRDLVAAGMDVMRINCAHDDAGAWRRMVDNLRAAEIQTGRHCRVLCDLAGPKLRTGPVAPGPGVLHWWPLRDDAGRVLALARVRITAEPVGPGAGEPVLPVEHELLQQLRKGDELRFTDVRGRSRRLTVIRSSPDEALGEADRNTYVASGAAVVLHRDGAPLAVGRIGALRPIEEVLRVEVGDRIVVTRDSELGRPAERDDGGVVLRPAHIGCTLPEVFRDVRPGEPIYFDDGKIGGVDPRRRADDRLEVRGHPRARRQGEAARRQGHQPARQPTSQLPALTDKDLADLAFVVEHADLVGLSFVRAPAGRRRAASRSWRELRRRAARHRAQDRDRARLRAASADAAPAALRSPAAGVMVARGDLGVERGFERLAEVQEEILWLCEAAHVPVIWATQVLESLAKTGMPVARRGHRRRDGRARRVRDAEQGAARGRGRALPRRRPAPHAGPPREEARHPAEAQRLGPGLMPRSVARHPARPLAASRGHGTIAPVFGSSSKRTPAEIEVNLVFAFGHRAGGGVAGLADDFGVEKRHRWRSGWSVQVALMRSDSVWPVQSAP